MSVVGFLNEEITKLEKEKDVLNKEIRRKGYMATGLLAVIFDTKDEELIQKARDIMDDAEKQE